MLCFVFLSMIFLHIIDDYVLQPVCLSKLKQKKFWEANAPNELYKNDYKMALLMHGFSWAFMIMLPIAIYQGFDVGVKFLLAFSSNTILHSVIDDTKANKEKINLITDQFIHLIQIAVTFIVLMI